MIDFLSQPGFLSTHAPLGSDLSLIFMLVSALMLSLGVFLIRKKHVELHRWIQTAAVILNTIVVLFSMARTFVLYYLPELPQRITQGNYLVTTMHAIVGLIGMLLGIFVVLRGNNLMIKSLRFRNYKLFMRISYGVYMAATVLGVIVYFATYATKVQVQG